MWGLLIGGSKGCGEMSMHNSNTYRASIRTEDPTWGIYSSVSGYKYLPFQLPFTLSSVRPFTSAFTSKSSSTLYARRTTSSKKKWRLTSCATSSRAARRASNARLSYLHCAPLPLSNGCKYSVVGLHGRAMLSTSLVSPLVSPPSRTSSDGPPATSYVHFCFAPIRKCRC